MNTILSTYVTSIRPIVRSKYKKKPTDMDSLFLSYEGRANVRLGRLITQYFMPYSLHITSTTIRSLVETEANILKKRGDITATDFSSLQNIGGHSEKTSEGYYIKNRTLDDINAGKRIFDKLESNRNQSLETGPAVTISNSTENVEEPFYRGTVDAGILLVTNTIESCPVVDIPQQMQGSSEDNRRLLSVDNQISGSPRATELHQNLNSQVSTSPLTIIVDTKPIVWGRLHPNFNQPTRIRAVWSEAELSFLRRVLSDFTDER